MCFQNARASKTHVLRRPGAPLLEDAPPITIPGGYVYLVLLRFLWILVKNIPGSVYVLGERETQTLNTQQDRIMRNMPVGLSNENKNGIFKTKACYQKIRYLKNMLFKQK